MSCVIPEISIRPLTPEDWAAIETLFGTKGACGGCWCMYWRVEKGGKSWDALRGEAAKKRFRTLVETGRAKGVLAFSGETPVGWACVGPYADFPRLKRLRAFAFERPERTWSIVCLYLPAKLRRDGLGTRLLEAARDFAFAEGAARVEGYPANVRSGQTLPGPFIWTGAPAMFERAGFQAVDCAGSARRLWLDEIAETRSGRSSSRQRARKDHD